MVVVPRLLYPRDVVGSMTAKEITREVERMADVAGVDPEEIAEMISSVGSGSNEQ